MTYTHYKLLYTWNSPRHATFIVQKNHLVSIHYILSYKTKITMVANPLLCTEQLYPNDFSSQIALTANDMLEWALLCFINQSHNVQIESYKTKTTIITPLLVHTYSFDFSSQTAITMNMLERAPFCNRIQRHLCQLLAIKQEIAKKWGKLSLRVLISALKLPLVTCLQLKIILHTQKSESMYSV